MFNEEFETLLNNKLNGNISVVRATLKKYSKVKILHFIQHMQELGYNLEDVLDILKHLD